MKSETFLRKHLDDYFDDNLLLAPHIPQKKLVTAARKIAGNIAPEYILAVVDTTVFKSAKEGIVFTGDSLYLHEGALGLNITQQIKYDQVDSAIFKTNRWLDDNENEQTSKVLTITLKDSEEPLIYSSSSFPLNPIAKLLTAIIEQVDDTSSTNQQVLSLTDLSEKAILSYLEIIINYLKRDGQIDQFDYANLAGLIGSLDLQDNLKDILLHYRIEPDYFKPTNILISNLTDEVPDASKDTIFQSLLNNLLSMMTEETKKDWKNIPEFTAIQTAFSISDEQIEVYLRKQEIDRKIIDDRLNDKVALKLVDNIKAMAGGVGASTAAFGVTGFAVGAFGDLGLGTLAFVTMPVGGIALAAAGIGAAGIAGYEGIKHLGSRPIEKEVMRNQLLQEKIKKQNAAMTLLMNDINYISLQISDLVNAKNSADLQVAQTTEKIAALKNFIGQLRSASNASTVAQDVQKRNQHELALAALPQSLNVEKVEDLLAQSAHISKFSTLLDHCYHFKDDGDNQLDENLSTQCLTITNEILEEIGYYKMATMASAKDLEKKGLGLLSSLRENKGQG